MGDMTEIEKYFNAIEDLKDVSKGGKDYAACSFMDISVRLDRLKVAETDVINALGKSELQKIVDKRKSR